MLIIRDYLVFVPAGLSPQPVCEDSIQSMVSRVGGYGGVIAVSMRGEVGVYFSTPAMAWAHISGQDKLIHHGLYSGEHFTEKLTEDAGGHSRNIGDDDVTNLGT